MKGQREQIRMNHIPSVNDIKQEFETIDKNPFLHAAFQEYGGSLYTFTKYLVGKAAPRSDRPRSDI